MRIDVQVLRRVDGVLFECAEGLLAQRWADDEEGRYSFGGLESVDSLSRHHGELLTGPVRGFMESVVTAVNDFRAHLRTQLESAVGVDGITADDIAGLFVNEAGATGDTPSVDEPTDAGATGQRSVPGAVARWVFARDFDHLGDDELRTVVGMINPAAADGLTFAWNGVRDALREVQDHLQEASTLVEEGWTGEVGLAAAGALDDIDRQVGDYAGEVGVISTDLPVLRDQLAAVQREVTADQGTMPGGAADGTTPRGSSWARRVMDGKYVPVLTGRAPALPQGVLTTTFGEDTGAGAAREAVHGIPAEVIAVAPAEGGAAGAAHGVDPAFTRAAAPTPAAPVVAMGAESVAPTQPAGVSGAGVHAGTAAGAQGGGPPFGAVPFGTAPSATAPLGGGAPSMPGWQGAAADRARSGTDALGSALRGATPPGPPPRGGVSGIGPSGSRGPDFGGSGIGGPGGMSTQDPGGRAGAGRTGILGSPSAGAGTPGSPAPAAGGVAPSAGKLGHAGASTPLGAIPLGGAVGGGESGRTAPTRARSLRTAENADELIGPLPPVPPAVIR